MPNRAPCSSPGPADVQLRGAPQANVPAPCGMQGCEDGAVLTLFGPEFPDVLTQQMNGLCPHFYFLAV